MKKTIFLFLSLLLVQYIIPYTLHADSTIKVGIYNNEPLVFADKDGKGKGFFADIIEYIASREKWQIEYVTGTWKQCLSRLENNEIDILCVIAFSRARDKIFDFNKANLLTNWGQVYAPVNSDIKTITDIAGKKVAVLKNDIHYKAFTKIMDNFAIDCDFIETDDYHSVLDLVSQNQADAGVVNRFFGMKNKNKYHVDKSGVIFNPIKMHFAVPEGKSKELLSTIDRHIVKLKEIEGSVYYSSLEKWFGAVSTKRVVPAWIKWILFSALGIIILFFFGNLILRNRINIKTKDLNHELERRKTAEKALKESREEYRLLIENQSDMVVKVDLKGRFQFVSPSYCEMFGKTEEELIGKTFMPLVHEEDRESTAKEMESLYHLPHTAYIEQRAMTKDGWKWLSWMDTAVLDEKKRVVSIIGVGRDITDRKQAEEINKALFSVSNAVNTTQKLKDLFLSIHHSIGRIIDVTNFFIAMVDVKKHTLHFPYHVDTADDDFAPITNFDPGDSLTGLVVSQRRPLLLKKKELEKRAGKKGVWGPVPLIWMGVPLMIKSEVIGVVAVQSYLNENLYDEQDLRLLSMVSEQISLAIHRKRAEEVLLESEKKYRHLFKNAPAGIYEIDFIKGKFIDVNEVMCRYSGYSEEEFLSLNPLDLLTEESKSTYIERLEKLSTDENIDHNITYNIIKKDGQMISVFLNSDFIYENGQLAGARVVAHDISQLKQAEESLKKSEARYRLIAENVADIIWTTDMNFNFTYISPSIYPMRGYTVEEAMKQTLEEVIHAESLEKIMDLFIKTINLIESGDEEGFNPVEFETKQLCKDGSVIWTSNNARILSDSKKQPVSILGITHDITDRKQAEKDKIEAQKITAEQNKLALVGQIAGKMAHDFNNLLGIVIGNAELALLDCKDSQIRKTLELIFEQTIRGKNLTKNLVAFAKDQEPKQHFFSINEKIGLVLSLLKKDLEGIDAVKEDGLGIPELLADPGMIEHALVNLIQNSIHAVSLVEQSRIILRTSHGEKNIYIEIEDNGCGIPEQALERIYEPAFTMKGSSDTAGSYKPGIKGTGYGMANVKKYIEQHKGNIEIDSKVGKGTKITISLPVMKKELTDKEKIEIQKKNFYLNKQILLVEDEQAISDVQYKILTHEPCNHKVDIAATGQMALDLFNRNKYDFISLDYVLSGELNGMDVYKHIRQINNTIPILFVSGNLDFLESIKELKQKDSNIDHLSKPCQNKDYVTAINDLLGKT